MIWSSTLVMTVIDLLCIGMVALMFAVAVRTCSFQFRRAQVKGPMMIVFGVSAIGLFHLSDLTTMLVLPSVLGQAEAMEIMEYLHLNIRWLVTPVSLALIFAGFLWILSDREQAEVALRGLTENLVRCEEQERRRIATYLHDHVGQTLAALRIKFGLLASSLNGAERAGEIEQIGDLLEVTMERTQNLSLDLYPPVLYELGLGAALEWIGERLSSEHGFRFQLLVEGSAKRLDEDNAALLFRASRELLMNVVKHARADHVWITLRWADDTVAIAVEDDGAGFDSSGSAARHDNLRFGLASVRERVQAMGGSFELDSRLGRGARVSLAVPVRNSSSGVEGVAV